VVTAVATLAAGLGASAANRGLLLSIWAVLAISFAGDTESAVQLAVAFAAGGTIAAVIMWLRTRALPEPSIETEATAASRTFEEILRSPLGWFSLLRATAAALAMALGVLLFPDHAVWAALTVLLVMKPKAGEAVAAGLLRTIGTLLGVLATEAVLELSGGDDAILIVAFMVAAFAMIALKNVNYAVFVACLTVVLVLLQELVGESGDAAASDRLFATILGSVIALIGLGVGRWIVGKLVVGPGEADEDQTPG
jgi:hypothetical protein